MRSVDGQAEPGQRLPAQRCSPRRSDGTTVGRRTRCMVVKAARNAWQSDAASGVLSYRTPECQPFRNGGGSQGFA